MAEAPTAVLATDDPLAARTLEKLLLLLLDFAMPGINGADVAAAALRLRPGQEIILVTGYSESSTIEHAAPNATLLRKPVALDALNEAVQEHLARGATRAEPNQP